MKRYKRIISAVTAVTCITLSVILGGCGETASNTGSADTSPAGAVSDVSSDSAETEQETAADENILYIDNNNEVSTAEEGKVLNFIPPEKGEEIAVITVKDFGVIKIKLFPEAAPDAVENFKGLINMNYYDELIFHRVIPGFMIQGGDPKGNGTGGKSIWGDKFDGGITEGLYHFTGAVAYCNSGSTATNGSQFYIVDTEDGFMDHTCEELLEHYPDNYNWPQNVIDLYKEKGGTPSLDGRYTVFGQVIEGIDVVRAIAAVETDPSNDRPIRHVTMETVRLEEYNGE